MIDKVKDILVKFAEVDREIITEESNLISDLDLNSLDVVNIIVAFEDEFNIEIPDVFIKDMITVGDIVKYLEENV